jgi:SAM-dependent methyltransferase
MTQRGMPPRGDNLDAPDRIDELRRVVASKPALKRLYDETYAKYAACLTRCPRVGIALELGSGASFAKDRLPELITSDVIEYAGLDRVVDATAMPFEAQSLRAIFMSNVFHHIPDVAAFLREAERCLMPGGRVFMVDQHVGHLSRFILAHAHHEPFAPTAHQWRFDSEGPLSGANGALAWMVFSRDRARFKREFPQLRLERYEPHTPLRYWLSGGLKTWSLLPDWAFAAATNLDRALVRGSADFGSFVDVELLRR